MKSKIVILLLILLSICGCSKNEVDTNKNKKEDKVKEEIKEEVNKYTDNNNTPIGIYQLQGNTLTKLHNYNTKLVVEKDINTFQIYPSNEEVITLNNSFGQSFYNEWSKYSNIKMGFNIKFSLNTGENISYNILNPSQTFDKWEYLMNYLYDDYANLGKSFYSHIEPDQFNENTLFTAFKMQASYSSGAINSKIQLTVFTYDSEDDFENGEYRGNSSYTLNICVEGFDC